MINTTKLVQTVQRYHESCISTQKRPTFKGLSTALGISPQTVSNIVHGTFNGNLYTENPAPTRCVDNNDFEIVMGLFRVDQMKNANL